MDYKEWIQMSQEERDKIFEESIKEVNRLSRKIEISRFFIEEGLKDLQDKLDELKIKEKLNAKQRNNRTF